MKKLIVSIISFLRARTKVVAILLALVGLLGLSQLTMAEDPVCFVDANLKAAVESALGISDPTPTDMLSLTNLNANDRGIVDLTGIEHATNLTYLWLYYNQISDISALSGLTNLTILYLFSNQISNISALSRLTNLTDLGLSNNQISDISALSGLTNLTSLRLDYNQISDISALSGLTNLTYLYLFSNQISNISALSGLTNLTDLGLSNNQISDISALSGLTNLRLDDNQQSVTPQQQIINLFHSTWGNTFKNKWYGISTVQNPLDVWITQEIMFETKPDVVVECGTYHGGSAILWATILKNIVPDARRY
ncbi:MAG: leucine-rich repeat domain-containing protein [Deltaproteobacteria bacterium]|nr:leucine-rich repeat domain-containing protein [Deltaproteobacteria bacterium]